MVFCSSRTLGEPREIEILAGQYVGPHALDEKVQAVKRGKAGIMRSVLAFLIK